MSKRKDAVITFHRDGKVTCNGEEIGSFKCCGDYVYCGLSGKRYRAKRLDGIRIAVRREFEDTHHQPEYPATELVQGSQTTNRALSHQAIGRAARRLSTPVHS